MKIGNCTFYSALLCISFYLPLSHALSIGSVEIESFLNQPLSFAIPVSQSASERWQAEDVLVSLADADTYHQQGLAYPWALGEITLAVSGGAGEPLLIRGRSKKVVRELLVALLIRVEWPKGSIQKEYTALIDVNGVTNVMPKPVVSPPSEPMQLSVQKGGSEQRVVVQPVSGDVVLAPASDAIERVELLGEQESHVASELDVFPLEERPKAEVEAAFDVPAEGYPNQDPVYLYEVSRGDVLSLLAQRFRGSVDLPLHQYIHSINNENIDQYPEGMEELGVGQIIRIPNPKHVAVAYTHTKRQLMNPGENVSHHRYQVRYGDSLFLIAQAFKPKGESTESFMQRLVADNPSVLLSTQQVLRPRVELRIANASYVEASPVEVLAPAVENEVLAEPSLLAAAPQSEEIAETELLLPEQENSPTSSSNETYFTAPIEVEDALVLAEGNVAIEARRGITPRLKANLREIEQYVGSDEKNLVYEVIQTNNRLPLLYEQLIRLNQQVSSLQLDMAELQVVNKQLRQEIKTLKQQQLDGGASRSIQWFLFILVILLLLACLAMYLYMRQQVRRLDFKSRPTPLAQVPVKEAPVEKKPDAIRTRTPRLKELWAVKSSKSAQQPVVVGEQDYSQYDISKSNYDYSQAYDVGALEEKIKSGENAFEHTPATIEFETYTENLITVKKLINSEEFVAAELLLDKLLAADSSQFDNWLARLELQLKTNRPQEADALYIQLQQMFVEPEQLAALENVMFPAQAMPEEECAAVSLPKASDYSTPDADKLYELRVYLSYSHLDMAELSIKNLLGVNPLFPETLLLKLEWLAAKGLQEEFDKLQKELEQRRSELSDIEVSTLEKLCEEAEFSPAEDETATVFDDSTQLLSQFDTEYDEDSAELTEIMDEGLDLDELEVLDDGVIEAENDDEKEFLAAIQEQMENYASEEAEAKSQADEQPSESSDKAVIPDGVRVFD